MLILYCHSPHLLKYRKWWLKLSLELNRVWIKIMKRNHNKNSLGKYTEKAFELHIQQWKKWEYSTSWCNIIMCLIYKDFHIKYNRHNDIVHILWFDILAEIYLVQNTNYHNQVFICIYILFIMLALCNECRKLERMNWVTKSNSRYCQKTIM